VPLVPLNGIIAINKTALFWRVLIRKRHRATTIPCARMSVGSVDNDGRRFNVYRDFKS
jgi:hypothetical protein